MSLERARSHRWWTLSVVSLVELMVLLDVTVVNVALPRAQLALHPLPHFPLFNWSPSSS